MDYCCNEKQQQTSSQIKLVAVKAVPASEHLEYSHTNSGYVHKSLTTLMGQFLAPDPEIEQHRAHKNTYYSVTNETYIQDSTAQDWERNVRSTETNSKNEDITLASLLGYSETNAHFEKQNNFTTQTSTTMLNIGTTETAYLTKFNNNCSDMHQISYVPNVKTSCGITNSFSSTSLYHPRILEVVDSEEVSLQEEHNGIRYEKGKESDDSDSSEWWVNSEQVHMGDVHRAVSEFLSGTGSGFQTQTIKEEFLQTNVPESVESNSLERSNVLHSAFNALSDNDYSIAANESCRTQVNDRHNPPIVHIDDNTLSEGDVTGGQTSESVVWESLRLGTPQSAFNMRFNGSNASLHYACNICDKTFAKLATVREHVQMHLGVRTHICYRVGCEKTFSSRESLSLHLRNCQGMTSELRSVPTHPRASDSYVTVTNAHTELDGNQLKVFACLKSGREFKDSISLQKHDISHEKSKSLACQSCEQNFPTYYARCKHWRDINSSCYKPQYASKKRRDTSESCEETFPTNYARHNHWRDINSSCYKPQYASKEQCDTHVLDPIQTNSHAKQCTKKVNLPCTKKRYKCKECDQEFTKERRLTDHVCYSTGADLYTCDTCSETFVRRSALVRHLRNHSME